MKGLNICSCTTRHAHAQMGNSTCALNRKYSNHYRSQNAPPRHRHERYHYRKDKDEVKHVLPKESAG